MSRITKWKIEKTKVKVVFRLQFHATHIPQSGWDKLFISFIPSDSGKATSKITKANVRNGTCKWADPIYETTRLLQDIKTRQYDEKLYKLVVGMGSSRSSILGEANINLADFVEALTPTAVALPLNGCEAGSTLHVTVQLLTSKTGFREFEQQRELRERGLPTTSDQGTHDESADSKESSPDQNVNNHINKASARVKLKKDSKEHLCVSSHEREAGLNEEYADSPVGLDGSSNTSENIYAEKHNMSSTHEVDSLKSTTSGDLGGSSLSQSPQPEKGDASDPSRSSDWVQGWTVDYSAANDMVAASEDNNRLKGNLEAIESSILDLKLEMCSLQNHADEIDVETNKFSEHLAAEISSGEALAKEVAILKSECSKFKEDFEQLKSSKLSSAYATREPTETDQYKFFQKLPPKWLKGLLLMEDRLRGIQKKVSMGYHERNSRFLNSELEALVEVLQDLKQESAEEISGTNIANGGESQEMASHKGDPFLAGTGSESDLFPPEGMVPYISIPGFVSHESDSIDPSLEMKGKFFELLRELDESKTERESLARKMDQMECYYEALVQELEQNQRQMMGELQNLRNEHSTCLYTISSSKTEIDRMHQNMKEQIIKFDEDKRILSSLNSDLEKRAVSAEAALKRARLNYSIAVGQLQKDLELLSCQVLSMYETNENLIKQAFSDSSLPSPDSCPETLKQLKNSEEGLTSNQFFCQNQNATLNKQHFGEDTLLKDLKQSLHLQEGLYKQVEEEVFHMHFVNIYLEVFSKALQETLLEASVDIRLMKEDIDRLSQQLQLSTESKDVLMLRLQNAMNDIHSLNEYKVSCTVRSNDIAHQNEILEANFKSLAHENHLLTQKIIDLEAHLTEYRSYESKYVACNAENLELKNFLKKESLVNDHLHDEISILQEELKAIRTEFDELASMKDNLQNVVSFLCNKLQKLIASYENKYSKLSLCSTSVCQDLESNKLEGLLLQLEEFQQSACDRILQLIEEKKVLVNEQNMTQVSLNTAKSDCVVMKQKFEHNLQEMVSNLSVSSALLQRLQLEFEMVVNTLKVGSDAEEIYSLHQKELLSDLVRLEAELQQLNTKNQDLAQEIFRLDNLSGDLEICKLSLAAITGEKETLEMSLQMKTKEFAKISSEIIFLKESLHSLHDELHVERTFREKLENTVTDLTSELNEKQCQLKDFESNKRELVQLKQMITDLESEKSRVSQLLLETDKRLEDVLRESSSINCLESQLSELHDFSIATDVIMIFTRAQFGGHVEELVEKLRSTCWQLEVFHKKNLDVEAELQQLNTRNQDLAREIFRLDTVSGDLEICKLSLAEITEEKEALEVYLQAKAEESAKISSELNFLKESMHALHDELHAERTLKGKLENTVTDLTSELNEKQCQLKDFESSKKELIQLKKMITDLESEKSRVSQLLLETDERLKDVLRESSSISCLETQLSELHDFSVATDVIMIFTRAQFGGHMEELVEKLHSTCRQLEVLHKKNVDVESELNGFLSRESTYVEENARLLISLDFLKSELEASTAQSRALVDQNSVIITELKEYKSKAENVNDIPCEHKSQCALEVARLENLLASCSREIEDLFFAKEELEVKCIVFLSELDELKTAMGLLNQSNDELRRLQNQCNELTKRLSEQVLKTEEFKNLSIHLKELKDKADAECLSSRERKGHEVQPVAMQESLRIAFIKEQYETKLQELKQQLSLSKKHSEEMLWKLQDAVDDIENRKKSEASLIKRNEELGMKILNLEAELQAVLSEKRNLLNAYDLVKAEKECSIISLECCKQEKQELESSLLKCNEEKSKIAIELTLTKELAENSGSRLDVLNEGNEVLHTMTCPSDEPIEEKLHARDSIFDLPTVGSDIVDKVRRNHSSVDPFSNSLNPKEVKSTYAACSQEPESSLIPFNMQPEDGLAFRGMSGYQTLGTEENLQLSEQKHVALCENLKSSLDHLNEELERMKNENLLPPVDNHNFEPSFPGLQRELMQLHEANQELGNIFPVFNEICVSGNALERVLALEIELAEALQAKKKSSMQFQSSFVKQHRDEEAIFRSFRDINELIKEMLELKERQVAVETELKEMHDRYSQLSLHFAEVEGERQKLMMTLKNTRAPNRALHSTTSFGDHSL